MQNFLQEETRSGFLVTTKRKKVWLRELEIMQQFINICEKHNLRYILADGSLLGAVRHQGFIPWDDDMDVGMPRKDYEEFLKIAKDELEYPFLLDDFETNKEMASGFARIRNNETTAFRRDVSTYKFPNQAGIFIDIFPYDNIPDNKFKRKLHQKRVYILKRLVNNSPLYGHDLPMSFPRKCFLMMDTILCKFIKPEKIYNHFQRVCQKYNNKDCKLSVYAVFDYKERFYVENKSFDDCQMAKFEFLNARIPSNYDVILTREYGDYHKFVIGTQTHDVAYFDTEVGFKNFEKDYLKFINDFNDGEF